MSKSVKKKKQVKRLFNLDIDEVSLVDKPAIGETFVVTKRLTTTKGDTVKPVRKGIAWKGLVSKSAQDSTHCVFCGITKAQEAEQLGMGLIRNVCFDCACEHAEKGVFDECIAGTFDAAKFAEAHPDMKLTLACPVEETAKSEEGEGNEEGQGAEQEQAAEEEAAPAESQEEAAPAEAAPAEEAAPAAPAEGGAELEKTVGQLKKDVAGLQESLESMLSLHEVAAGALNEIVSLTFGCMEMSMGMMEQSEEMDEKQSSLFTEILQSIKSERANVEKKGAKISASRMQVLRDISQKLAELIQSVAVAEGGMKGGKKTKALGEIQKSVQDSTADLKKSVESLKSELDQKLKDVDQKLSDLQQSGGASDGLTDEDEEQEQENAPATKSVFAGIIGVEEIKDKIAKRQNLQRKK